MAQSLTIDEQLYNSICETVRGLSRGRPHAEIHRETFAGEYGCHVGCDGLAENLGKGRYNRLSGLGTRRMPKNSGDAKTRKNQVEAHVACGWGRVRRKRQRLIAGERALFNRGMLKFAEFAQLTLSWRNGGF